MTPRDQERRRIRVLELTDSRWTTAQIAQELGISKEEVKRIRHRARVKMYHIRKGIERLSRRVSVYLTPDVHDRLELMAFRGRQTPSAYARDVLSRHLGEKTHDS